MHRLADDEKEIDTPGSPPAGLVAAGLVGAVVAVGIVGWLIFRSRRRLSLVKRLRGLDPPDLGRLLDAVPDSVREIPEGLRARVRRIR